MAGKQAGEEFEVDALVLERKAKMRRKRWRRAGHGRIAFMDVAFYVPSSDPAMALSMRKACTVVMP